MQKWAADLRWGAARSLAHVTTTRRMISNPKLPFASDSPALAEAETPSAVPAPATNNAQPLTPPSHLGGAHRWLRRVGVLTFVFLCATVGVMLMILPWRPEWTGNHLLLPYPTLRSLVGSGFVRGACTGLGVLNVWIGFWEAIQYREEG
ncbi:MAG: hypothetical protein ACHP7J_03650 [Terriglobales bacterium]